MISLYTHSIQLPDVQIGVSLVVAQRRTEARDQTWETQICYPRLVFSSEKIRIITASEYILSPSPLMAVLLGDLKVATNTNVFVVGCETYALEHLLQAYYGVRAGATVEYIIVRIGHAKQFYDIARQVRTKFQSKTGRPPLVEQVRKLIPASVRFYFDLPSLLGDISDQTWSDMREWCYAGEITRVSERIESILKSAGIDPSIVEGGENIGGHRNWPATR